jgi:TATA-box binding protein (TBP) (component of TFIID and TFIIIB)
MEVVNAVYRGRLEDKVNLSQVHKNLPNSILHTNKIPMIVLKDKESTIMLFSSGKFRIMGSMVDELEAICKAYGVFSKLGLEVSFVTLQTMTVKLKFEPINLYLLSNLIQSRLDLEIFPALMVTKYKPVSVNVFATGSVMICGVKSLDLVNEIEHDLKLLL